MCHLLFNTVCRLYKYPVQPLLFVRASFLALKWAHKAPCWTFCLCETAAKQRHPGNDVQVQSRNSLPFFIGPHLKAYVKSQNPSLLYRKPLDSHAAFSAWCLPTLFGWRFSGLASHFVLHPWLLAKIGSLRRPFYMEHIYKDVPVFQSSMQRSKQSWDSCMRFLKSLSGWWLNQTHLDNMLVKMGI